MEKDRRLFRFLAPAGLASFSKSDIQCRCASHRFTQPQNPEGRVEVVLVLRQGTGLALSTPILPPGCSQKRSPALLNTQKTFDCYEVTEQGIRAVRVSYEDFANGFWFRHSLAAARRCRAEWLGPRKPRVAPRMSTASPSVAAA